MTTIDVKKNGQVLTAETIKLINMPVIGTLMLQILPGL